MKARALSMRMTTGTFLVKNHHSCAFQWIVVVEYICWSTMFYYIETVFLYFAKEEEYKKNIEGIRVKMIVV